MKRSGFRLPSNSGGSNFMSLKSSTDYLGGLLSLLGGSLSWNEEDGEDEGSSLRGMRFLLMPPHGSFLRWAKTSLSSVDI